MCARARSIRRVGRAAATRLAQPRRRHVRRYRRGRRSARLRHLQRIGGMAAWQPISTERRWGWAVRWSTLFGHEWDASAAKRSRQIYSPSTWTSSASACGSGRGRRRENRYLTARAGGMLLRSNEPDPAEEQRAFLGGVAQRRARSVHRRHRDDQRRRSATGCSAVGPKASR